MHYNQQVILSLLFYQASHEGRIYSLPKLQKSRRVTVSRPVCLDLNVMCQERLTLLFDVNVTQSQLC